MKRTSRKQATPLRGNSSGPGWLSGFLLGLILGGATVFYLLAIHPSQNISTTGKSASNTKDKIEESKKKSEGPRFDFYKLLPENADSSATTKPAATPSPIPTVSAFDAEPVSSVTPAAAVSSVPVETKVATADSKAPGKFLLQAGSFRTNSDADRVRANILLLGLPSRVEAINNEKGETFYRVYVGSFSSEADMKNAQTLLSKNKITTVVVKSK